MRRKKPIGKPIFGSPVTDDPDDAPELLEEFFRTAEWRDGDKVIRPGRPPLGDQPKKSVTLRLDADVLESYRALGAGWQSQINADLRKVRKLKAAS
ncbi:hypothetical protein RPMA_15425 [Tardiphaga alba]|uniref:BrnA antitoxin of type II toxin-antitoxin system n=1 Tax=Tardiphaga alba TaxID=340268 RepID=A0ABX8ACL5_9BRAD|nr:BrnA antitoxin family protein [Tardiphaga alba]QUS40065.1 hypothetical protein RPMA_15425 [Tardiphaga alba]